MTAAVTGSSKRKRQRLMLIAAAVLALGWILLRRSSSSAGTADAQPADSGVAASDGSLGTAGAGTTALAGTLEDPNGPLADINTALAQLAANQQSLSDALMNQAASGPDFGGGDTSGATDTSSTDTSGSTDTSSGAGDGTSPPKTARGFWWGGRFFRPGQRKQFEAWEHAHGGKTGDPFYSQHPAIARIFGMTPPPPKPKTKHPTSKRPRDGWSSVPRATRPPHHPVVHHKKARRVTHAEGI